MKIATIGIRFFPQQSDVVIVCVSEAKRTGSIAKLKRWTSDEVDEFESQDLHVSDPEKYLKALQVGYRAGDVMRGAYCEIAAELLKSGGRTGDFYVFDGGLAFMPNDILAALANADHLSEQPELVSYFTLTLNDGKEVKMTVAALPS